MTPCVSLFILAWISRCLCSLMTCSEKSSLRSHRPSLLKIQLYFDSQTLQLSMVSPRFSVIEFPSLMLCNCCKQLIAIENIWRADCSTLPDCLWSYLMSFSVTFCWLRFAAQFEASLASCSEMTLSCTNLLQIAGICASSRSDYGTLFTFKIDSSSSSPFCLALDPERLALAFSSVILA